LKPANLLLTDKGVLKLADFGLARAHGSPNLDMTFQVVTRWYRAPELLFGARKYGEGIDIWAAGCIFAEIILREALFATTRENDTDIGQLSKVFNVMGTPTAENWPSASILPNYVEFEPREPLNLSNLFPTNEKEENSDISPVLDVILKMLVLDPSRRISASKAIQHTYFNKEPKPCRPEDLPKPKD
jgi:cyclin-dependent kinase 7